MDPTLDPIPTGTAPRVGGSPPDLAAVVARVELIERRLDTLERGQRPTIASLPARAHPRPTIEPIHTIAATPDPVRPAAAAPGVAPAPFVAPAPMATTIAPPTSRRPCLARCPLGPARGSTSTHAIGEGQQAMGH